LSRSSTYFSGLSAFSFSSEMAKYSATVCSSPAPWPSGRRGLEHGASGLEQVELLDHLKEGLGAPALGLEVLAELDGVLGELGRLAVLEEGGVGLLGHGVGRAVDADDHPLALVVVGEHEGIAADVGRQIGVRARRCRPR
jgi:hypothetical protein